MKTNWIIFILLVIFYNFCLANGNEKEILIVYHSQTGNTKLMAEAVAEGAKSCNGVAVKLFSVDSVKITDVTNADAIIIGSPVYNANTAPEIQEFINKWPFKNSPMKNKIAAAFVCGGGISAGEEIVQMNILKSMLVFGMIIVGGDDWKSAFGASAVVAEQPFTDNLNSIFIEKARNLGKRVAEVTKRFHKI